MVELLERPVRTQRPDRLVHACHERVPLLKDEAEVLTAWLRRELAEHLGVRDLDGRHVESGREADYEPVDLLVLQRLNGSGVSGEDRRLLRGLDLALDQLVTRRAELRAELIRLEAGNRRDLGDR